MAVSSVNVNSLAVATGVLKNGGVVAFPTDTLYGLGADVSNAQAVDRVFEIKGRTMDSPLPVLIGECEDLYRVGIEIPEIAKVLINNFWPGQLTLVVKRSELVSSRVTCGRDTVAVRMPDHYVPISLARLLGGPITGTSANISGNPNLESSLDVAAHLGDKVDYILDGGLRNDHNLIPSTIIDISGHVPKVLREGIISNDSLRSVWDGTIEI